MGFIRVVLIFFVLLVALHLVLRLWLRLRERRRLGQEWEAGDRLVTREIFVQTGMDDYDRSLRKRLLWLTVVLPMAGLILVLYLVNET
ncbi:MAG: hypothetical protein AVDCRST_MAG15-1531 [uncultured Rubellimicrobium sp.]|uniref:Cation/multidrug efflux pump n=1 Tax=uncultured Rubellimicrobium sp. TaxID=543078 RepID=A0A6J4PBI7_9RHOB|nr:MAG: hypothetical protein AVDCRST_MAG15-1531 [uncultured Rubellimicrobium sp.]